MDQLEAILVTLPEDLLSLLLLHSLPREYQPSESYLRVMTISLPSQKLLDEEMQIRMDTEKETSEEVLWMRKGNSSSSNKRATTARFLRGSRPSTEPKLQFGRGSKNRTQPPRNCPSSDDTYFFCREKDHWEDNCELKKTLEQMKCLEQKFKSLDKKSRSHPYYNRKEKVLLTSRVQFREQQLMLRMC